MTEAELANRRKLHDNPIWRLALESRHAETRRLPRVAGELRGLDGPGRAARKRRTGVRDRAQALVRLGGRGDSSRDGANPRAKAVARPLLKPVCNGLAGR